MKLTCNRRLPSIAITACLLFVASISACDSDAPPRKDRKSVPADSTRGKAADEQRADENTPPREPPVESVPGVAGRQRLNIIAFAPRLISGAVPENAADFALLANHQIKTIISVDGATPDVEEAKRFGMRYVHLPIGYHGIDKERQLEIARAVRDLPMSIYIHCHHGKHRGPAAAATAAVALGMLSNEQATMMMRHAGTSPNYVGLYQSVSTLGKIDDAEIDATPAEFPETAPVPDFVKAMAEIAHAYDHLRQIRAAGWQAPDHHPDLVPLAEAGKLENLLRALQDDPKQEKYPSDFKELLRASWQEAVDFEKMLTINVDPDDLNQALDRVGQSCNACHAPYRNQK